MIGSNHRVNELMVFVDRFETQSFFELFKKADFTERLELLSSNQCALFDRVYSKFDHAELAALIDLLPIYSKDQDQHSFQPPQDPQGLIPQADCQAFSDLIKKMLHYYNLDVKKAVDIFGQIFLRAPAEVCKKPEIAILSIYLSKEIFWQFLKKQPYRNLPLMFFFAYKVGTIETHALYDILRGHGPETLAKVFRLLTDKDYQKLKRELNRLILTVPLYEKLLRLAGPHEKEIIALVNDQIGDHEKKRILLEHRDTLSFESQILLLTSLPPKMRCETLLTRLPDIDQTYFLERIGIDSRSDGTKLLDVLILIHNHKDRFDLLAHPIKYAVRRNTSTLSSFAGHFLGSRAKSAIDSLQAHEDISESLISRMIQRNLELEIFIPAMLGGLASNHITKLLRDSDSTGKTLFSRLLSSCEKNDVFEVLSSADFHTKDSERLLDLNKTGLNYYRELLRNNPDCDNRLGFIAFLNLYNYLAVRSREPGLDRFQTSKNEFLEMVQMLKGAHQNNGLLEEFHHYCERHPLQKALTLSGGSSSVQLGTNRHLDARTILGELTENQMRGGLLYFQAFILIRIEGEPFVDENSLDRSIGRVFQAKSDGPKNLPV